MVRVSTIALVATAVFCSVSAVVIEEPCQGENEAKYPCGTRCEERCNAALPGFCRGLQCLGFSCRCRTGFARDTETGQCVRTENCPPSRCGFGEIIGPCGKACEGTCTRVFDQQACQTNGCIGVDCRCDVTGGYVRNEKTGRCVKIEDC